MIKFFLPIGVAVVALLGLSFFIYQDFSDPTVGENESDTASTTMTSESGDITLKSNGDVEATMEEVPEKAPAAASSPSLDRPYNPTASLPSAVKVQLQTSYSALVATLRANPGKLEAWIELGVYRKNAGDYKGAEEAWLYVSRLAPGEYVTYANLGNLYDFHLKDYAKAEANYRKVVALKPDYIAGYLSLYDLYKNRYQTGSAKAEGALLEGLAKNPKNTDLLMSLANFYKGTGKTEDARARFLEARVVAEAAGNTSLVAAIDAEIAAL